jgi:hypothetical protein
LGGTKQNPTKTELDQRFELTKRQTDSMITLWFCAASQQYCKGQHEEND